MQKSLGSDLKDVLETENGRVGLTRDACLDVDILMVQSRTKRLRRTGVADWPLADVAALEAAVNLRDGGFLDGLDGDWTQAARQRCSDIYEAGLEALIAFHRHRGHVERSIAAARKLASQDPYREDVHAVLVEMYGRKGQTGRAMEQYSSCRELLRSDLGVEPGKQLVSSLLAAMTPDEGDNGGDLIGMLSRIDRRVAHLANRIDDIHALLNGRASGSRRGRDDGPLRPR